MYLLSRIVLRQKNWQAHTNITFFHYGTICWQLSFLQCNVVSTTQSHCVLRGISTLVQPYSQFWIFLRFPEKTGKPTNGLLLCKLWLVKINDLWEWSKSRTPAIPNASKNVEEQELSSTACFLIKLHISYHTIQQVCSSVFTQRSWKLMFT